MKRRAIGLGRLTPCSQARTVLVLVPRNRANSAWLRLLADGSVEFNAAEQCWVARVDWTRLRHASQEQSLPLR